MGSAHLNTSKHLSHNALFVDTPGSREAMSVDRRYGGTATHQLPTRELDKVVDVE